MLKTFQEYGIDTRGKSGGEIKTLCPECSKTRKKKNVPCLNVNIDKGVWNCWHCGWAGGLGNGIIHRPKVSYIKPDYVASSSGIDPDIASWFASRGISEGVLVRNQIGKGKAYFPQVEEERGCILFPYMRNGEVVNIKYRTRDKMFRLSAGAERILYGLQDVSSTLIWVEGEIDKLSVEEAGFKNCVSVPDGAPAEKTKNYETKFDFLGAPELDVVSTHIIAVDSDEPGKLLQRELIRRLGPEKCLVVRWPDGYKDANEVLVGLGSEALSLCIESAEHTPIVGAFSASDFSEEFADMYNHGTHRGLSTGWDEIDALYTVRPGEMTILTGIPNSGKSEWLDALMVNLAHYHGWGFAVFSAENWPVTEHMKKLSEKYIGKPFDSGPTERMTAHERQMAETWLDKHFKFVMPEEPTIESILSIVRQLVTRHGVRGFVLDPWNEIEHSRPESMSETEYIGKVLSEIRRFARLAECHAWIVAHPTKLHKNNDGSYPVPTPYDISGSANWRNKADNCISVWRDLSPTAGSGVEIHIQKIRHKVVGRLGMGLVNYDRVTGRYTGEKFTTAPYLARPEPINEIKVPV